MKRAIAAIKTGAELDSDWKTINEKMLVLQTEVASLGFAMGASTAKLVGSYLAHMNDIWYGADFYKQKKFEQWKLPEFEDVEKEFEELMQVLKLPPRYVSRFQVGA